MLVEGYKTAAEGIAGRATANVSQLLGCAETDATCVDGFIQRLGSRAYRRPLQPDEAQRRRALYDWGVLERVLGIERDAGTYAGYSASIPALLEQETETFIDHVVWDADGKLGTLLTAPYTFLDGALASFYGMTAPGGSFSKVQTGASRRMGFLTHGSLLSMHAQPLQTSPVNRGVFVRETLLCQTIAPPPANLAIIPPDLDPKLTTRQRFAQHSVDPACAAPRAGKTRFRLAG